MDFVGKLLSDVCPPASVMAETQTDVLFQSGTVAMITQGSWMVPAFKQNEYTAENCDVAMIPYDKETGVRASICNGLGWAAAASTKRADDCWKLIEWLGSEEMQIKQAELGVTMSAYEGTSDAWASNTDLFNLAAHLDMAEESKVDGVENKVVEYPFTYNAVKWTSQCQKDLVAAWDDPSLMEEKCKEFAGTMNDIIASESK
jgi:multiple sugar transport system substrate-binding protein